MIYNFLYASLFAFNISLFAKNSSTDASNYLHEPSGAFNVGYKKMYLINKNACPNVFFNHKNVKSFSKANIRYCNEIELVAYYPSEDRGAGVYRPISSLISDLKEFGGALSAKDIKQIKKIRSHAKKNAIPVKNSFPMIFFSPGYGLPTQEYENTLTDLASHGYLVLGINSQFINGDIGFNNKHHAKSHHS